MKGIILAGGSGTRLYPITKGVSKQVLAIYDKPMIYYPLSTLMLAGIREVLIISTPRDISTFQDILGDGSQLGMRFEYAIQAQPNGLAEAFIIGEKFIGGDSVCLILGDNFFYGQNITKIMQQIIQGNSGATIFGYPVKDPGSFGVVAFDDKYRVTSLEEKPKFPKSNYAVPGLYFYDNSVIEIAKSIQPSNRGELEITSVNNEYLRRGQLSVQLLGRGITWLDTGTPAAMHQAASFVETIQRSQGYYISCIEEVAWRRGFITLKQMLELGEELKMTDYGRYILSYAKEGERAK